MDKDGDKKEPMKKAIKDKKAKKESVDEGAFKKKDKKVADITKESLEEAKLIVEMGCVGEMKKLNASGCSKNEMYKKINAEYNCGKEKFEKLYASHCG